MTRAIGNHKGVLTRNRQPKMAAYIIKNRYKKLEDTQREHMEHPAPTEQPEYVELPESTTQETTPLPPTDEVTQ